MQRNRIEATTVQQFLNGISQELGKVKAMTVGNKQYTPAALTKILSGYVTAANAAQAAKVAYRKAVAEQHALAPSVLALMGELKDYVYATYGDAPAPLAAFGLLPRKARVASAVSKAAAVLKGAATREQRHPKAAAPSVLSTPTSTSVMGGVAGAATPVK
jgi:hypothetical protein